MMMAHLHSQLPGPGSEWLALHTQMDMHLSNHEQSYTALLSYILLRIMQCFQMWADLRKTVTSCNMSTIAMGQNSRVCDNLCKYYSIGDYRVHSTFWLSFKPTVLPEDEDWSVCHLVLVYKLMREAKIRKWMVTDTHKELLYTSQETLRNPWSHCVGNPQFFCSIVEDIHGIV